jgi:DNA polymerase I-like protein with 3'-5' exonuclease and polymerase domains
VVNVPKPDPKVVYGKEMRSMFVAPEGGVCVGCDAAGLEARVAGHYTYTHDGGEYARVLLEGDTHSVNAAAYSEAIQREVTRGDSKPITYGTLYGASGKKIAAMLDVSLALGQRVVDAFWDANPGLKAYKEALEHEWHQNGKRFVWGIDGRYIRTRSKHSLVNAVFQSAGAIIMDRSWYIARQTLDSMKFTYERWGYFHDEYQLYAASSEAEAVGVCLADAIKCAGEYYNMNVPLAGDFKIGRNWSDTH